MRLMPLLCLFIIILLGGPSPLKAEEGWPTISPDQWGIKPDSEQARKGAVVLYQHLKLDFHTFDFWYRVRIVSESGKAAAEFQDIPTDFLELEARTFYPDGKVVTCNSRKDFKTRTDTFGGYERKRVHLIPPGLTSNCIFELHYRQMANWKQWSYWQRYITGAYPIKELRLDVAHDIGNAWIFAGAERFHPETWQRDGFHTFILNNLQADDDGPYTLKSTLGLPRLIVYDVPLELRGALDSGPNAFWNKVSSELFKYWLLTKLHKGRNYTAFSKEVLADLPPHPHLAAKVVQERVNARVLNIGRLSWEDRDSRKKANRDEWKRVDAYDLSEIIERGYANDLGKHLLIYQLLTDANLHPRILCATDRDKWLFQYQMLAYAQYTGEVLGVDDPNGQTMWLDAGDNLMPPGLIHPDYQGTAGLLIEPKNWTAAAVGIPALPESFNTQAFAYDLNLDGETLAFQLNATFTGHPAYTRRVACYQLEPSERERSLKEAFETTLKGWTISATKVQNVLDLQKPFVQKVQGARDIEGGQRVEISPFPGMPSPYVLPDTWPEQRNARIILPFRKTHKATCTFLLPEGFTLNPQTDISRQNLFGTVKWTLIAFPAKEGTKVTLEFEVQAKAFAAPAEHYVAFKDFMSWISEAMDRRLVIVKRG